MANKTYHPKLDVVTSSFSIQCNETKVNLTKKELEEELDQKFPNAELNGDTIVFDWNQALGICKSLNQKGF